MSRRFGRRQKSSAVYSPPSSSGCSAACPKIQISKFKFETKNWQRSSTSLRTLCRSVSGVKSLESGNALRPRHRTALESPALATNSLPQMKSDTSTVHPPATRYLKRSSAIKLSYKSIIRSASKSKSFLKSNEIIVSNETISWKAASRAPTTKLSTLISLSGNQKAWLRPATGDGGSSDGIRWCSTSSNFSFIGKMEHFTNKNSILKVFVWKIRGRCGGVRWRPRWRLRFRRGHQTLQSRCRGLRWFLQ